MREPNNPSDKPERRGKRRKATNLRAWADPGGVQPVIDCVIHDVSEDGARLAATGGRELPDTFTLQLTSTGPKRRAKVMWRNDRAVGAKLD